MSATKLADFFNDFNEPTSVHSEIWIRSCNEEILEPIEGVLKGEIPKWLNGTLIMNGPGKYSIGSHELNHLFDGSALLQKFTVTDKKITYQNKFIKSEAYTKGHENNRVVFGEFGTAASADSSKSFFKKLTSLASKLDMATDNTFISVYPISGDLYALTETARYNQIDINTLDLKTRVDLEEKFEIISYTAHPHVMNDGSVYNIGHTVTSSGAHYNILHFPNTPNLLENVKIIAKLPTRFKLHPSYFHSFGITENYFVIIETPFTMSVTSLLKMVMVSLSFTDILKWLPDENTRIILINRQTGKLEHVFYADPFYFLYIVNQYEKDDHVVLDICCYKNSEIINATFAKNLKTNDPKEAHKFYSPVLRFVLPLSSDKTVKLKSLATAYVKDNKIFCTPELVTKMSCIFPRINYPEFCGIDYQFFYAVAMDFDENYGALVKVDVKNNMKIVWKDEKVFAWEPHFIPSPDATSEDDGIIIAGYSLIDVPNMVGLIILNASDFIELARCEFSNLSTTIAKPLHGWFTKK